MTGPIITPLDGSDIGEQALPLAAELARRAGSELILVHVNEAVVPAAFGETLTGSEDWLRELNLRAEEYLEDLAGRFGGEDGPVVRTEVLLGSAPDRLESLLRDKRPELAVMATHGRGGWSRLWLGSIAQHLVRSTSVPLLLIRPREDAAKHPPQPHVERILVPLDGSELAESILPDALAMARRFGARLTLVGVVQPAIWTGYRYRLHRAEAEADSLKRRWAAAEKYFEELTARLRGEGVPVDVEIKENAQPGVAILEYAADSGADLIAMATHGRGGVGRVLVGSVADKVIRGSPVPVLARRPAERT